MYILNRTPDLQKLMICVVNYCELCISRISFVYHQGYYAYLTAISGSRLRSAMKVKSVFSPLQKQPKKRAREHRVYVTFSFKEHIGKLF